MPVSLAYLFELFAYFTLLFFIHISIFFVVNMHKCFYILLMFIYVNFVCIPVQRINIRKINQRKILLLFCFFCHLTVWKLKNCSYFFFRIVSSNNAIFLFHSSNNVKLCWIFYALLMVSVRWNIAICKRSYSILSCSEIHQRQIVMKMKINTKYYIDNTMKAL